MVSPSAEKPPRQSLLIDVLKLLAAAVHSQAITASRP